MALGADRRSNFSPPAHLCAVTYMTEISLIVTLNNQFIYPRICCNYEVIHIEETESVNLSLLLVLYENLIFQKYLPERNTISPLTLPLQQHANEAATLL